MKHIIHEFIQESVSDIINNKRQFSFSDGCHLVNLDDKYLMDILFGAWKIRQHFSNSFQHEHFTCSIMNVKSGQCQSDCKFCAQSAHYKTNTNYYPLLSKQKMVEQGLAMYAEGSTTFSIVTSGMEINSEETDLICEVAQILKQKTNLILCASLGKLNLTQAQQLKLSGFTRYHHNMETAPSYYPSISTSQTSQLRKETLLIAKEAKLQICSGGIFGLGESWEQRVEFATTLRECSVNCVPINFLVPIQGTPLEKQQVLTPFEALKAVALMRFILPQTDITIAGGRKTTLKDYQSWLLLAGANGTMIGDYLTTSGCDISQDLSMLTEGWKIFHN